MRFAVFAAFAAFERFATGADLPNNIAGAPSPSARSFASIAGASDRLGSLEAGKIANVLVTEGDLFDNKMVIKHVFVDGRAGRAVLTDQTSLIAVEWHGRNLAPGRPTARLRRVVLTDRQSQALRLRRGGAARPRPVAFAGRHRGIAQEDIGERQPLPGRSVTLVMDGRLDHREELLPLLNLLGQRCDLRLSRLEAWPDGFAARLSGALPSRSSTPRDSGSSSCVMRSACARSTTFAAIVFRDL